MTPKLFDQVVLRRDVPGDGLRAGDVARLIDLIDGPPGQPRGAVLEVFNAGGDTVCVTAVSADDIEPLRGDDLFTVRRQSA